VTVVLFALRVSYSFCKRDGYQDVSWRDLRGRAGQGERARFERRGEQARDPPCGVRKTSSILS
jgi:hypothetical protein